MYMNKHSLSGILASIATAIFTIIIIVPPPMPTDGSQCKKDGWEQYGVFNNQGDCVSYVATDGRNQPSL